MIHEVDVARKTAVENTESRIQKYWVTSVWYQYQWDFFGSESAADATSVQKKTTNMTPWCDHMLPRPHALVSNLCQDHVFSYEFSQFPVCLILNVCNRFTRLVKRLRSSRVPRLHLMWLMVGISLYRDVCNLIFEKRVRYRTQSVSRCVYGALTFQDHYNQNAVFI